MLIADILSSIQFASANAAPIGDAVPGGSVGIEYSVSLGNLLTICSFVVFATVYVVNARGAAKVLAGRLEMVDATLEDFKQEMKRLSEIIAEQIRQDGRLNLVEQRLMQEGKRLDELGSNLGEFKNIMLKEKL